MKQTCLNVSQPLARLLVVLAVTLPCAPLLAAERTTGLTEEVAWRSPGDAPHKHFSWISGGIGDESLQEMHRAAPGYNVHVLFSNRRGYYLADIPFAISGRNGREIYSGVSDGPLLYLRLPAGAYRVSAEIDGVWHSRTIRTASRGRPVKLSFVARRE